MEGYHIKAVHRTSFCPYGFDNLNVVETSGTKKGHTAAQIALAWLLAQGAGMAPIPGTKHRAWLVCADAVDRADTVIGYGDRGDGALAITRRG